MSLPWSELHFLRPQAFWCLLALPLLLGFVYYRQQRANAWRTAVDPHLLPHLLVPGRRRVLGTLAGMALALVIAVTALAGPSWRQGEQALWQQRAPLVIALDLSSATLAADLPPSRLLQARGKLATLLRERQGGQVALIAYADDAFTVAPMTEDAANVALFLDALSPEVMPVDGQRGDRAIEQAIKLMRQAGFTRGDILLMTDHADSATQNAAAQAASQGYRVSVLGLGSTTGAAYRGVDGQLQRARLDADSLRILATRGGGRFETVQRGDEDLVALGVLDPPSLQADAGTSDHRRSWLDEGYWLLLPLMLLSLFAFRRGAAWVLVCGVALGWSAPGQAQAQAQEKGGWWQRADQRDHAQVAQGVDAYRRGDFAKAEQAFAGKTSADALYNQGNALAKQGRYDEAIAAYDAALAKQPGMADAVANRTAVQRVRKQQQQPSQGQDGGQSSQSGKAKSPPSQGSNASQPSSPQQTQPPPKSQDAQAAAKRTPTPPAPQQPTSPAQKSPTPQGAQPPQAADAKAQQAADAAQRQRMQQALAKAGEQAGKDPARAAQAVKETPEQREQRQALEAWLRRVPDDPGGLLKAKFELENERRRKEGP